MRILRVLLAALLLTAPVEAARDFDGSNDELSCGSTIDNFTNLSVCFRMRHDTSSVADQIAGKCDSTLAVAGWAVRSTAGDSIVLIRTFTGTDGQWVPTTFTMGTGWRTYCVAHDGTTGAALWWLDGVSVAVTTSATPTGTLDADAGQTLCFGETACTGTADLDGALQDVVIANKIITDAEANRHYHTGFIDGNVAFHMPLRTTKLTNEGTTAGATCTAAATTVTATQPKSWRNRGLTH